KKAPDRAVRDIFDDAAFDPLSRQLTLTPMADRNIERFRVLTGKSHDLADLLGRECAGAPERGASLNRAATPNGASAFRQRRRQWPAVLRQIPSCCAVSVTPTPVAASKMIRARSARFWGVECARTKAFSSRSCSGDSWIGTAL